MKFLYSLGAASAALGAACFPATAQADFGLMNSEEFSGIYDDFSSPAGAPDPNLWIVKGNGNAGATVQSDNKLVLNSSGIGSGNNVDVESVASFGYGTFTFTFSSSNNSSYRGFGLVAGTDRILLRDDTFAGSLRLDVFTNGISVVDPTTITGFEYGPDDVWEFQYFANQLTLLRNSNVVFENDNLNVTSGPVKISMFAYSGGSMKFDSISAPSPIPEPSTYAAIAGVLALVAGIARRSLRRANRD